MTSYTIKSADQECRVALEGDLTASLVPDLQAALKQQLEQGTSTVVFDLEKTAVLDSSGIGLMIAVSNTLAKRQGRMRVCGVSKDILQLLQSMRLVARLNASGRE
jgi:serine/threonine-protein kinase RsbW